MYCTFAIGFADGIHDPNVDVLECRKRISPTGNLADQNI
jgi:hypothetical protein